MKVVTRVFAALLLTALIGCGRGTTGPSNIDPAFKDIANRFNAEAAAHGSSARAEDLTIQFGDLSSIENPNGTEQGLCDTGSRTIKIDQHVWPQLSPAEQEELVFHELGHCVLRREHDPDMTFDVTNGFVPESIMHASLVGWGVYSSRRAEYLDELFK